LIWIYPTRQKNKLIYLEVLCLFCFWLPEDGLPIKKKNYTPQSYYILHLQFF
jgi:hypothetical protein